MGSNKDWFGAMSAAVKERDRALNGLARWQEKVNEAEAEIEKLTAQRETGETLPTPAKLAEEAETLNPALRPVFGAGTAEFNTVINQ